MKFKSFLASLAAAALAVACNDPNATFEPTLEVNGLKLDQNAVTAVSAGTNFTFSVKSNVSLTVTSSQDWATVTPSTIENLDNETITTNVTVTVDENKTETARTAAITLKTDKYASLDYTFDVNQAAAVYNRSLSVLTSTLTPINGPIEVEAKDAQASVMVVSTVSWTASSNAAWLTVEPASATVENYEETPTIASFKIADNTATEAREATVTFTGDGVEPCTVKVTQAAKVEYQFDIDVTNIAEVSATVVCLPSDKNVHFLLSCEKPGYVNQFATGAELAAADIEYFRGQFGNTYANYGFNSFEDLFYNGLCDSGDTEWNVKDLSSSQTYIAYVFAVDEELNVVSDVFKKEFTTLEMNASDDYLKWIGSWTLTGANGAVNNCKIELAASNVSYTISGLQGFSDKIDCAFNTDGSLSIKVTDLEDYTHSTYGPIDLWFYGAYNNGTQDVSITGTYNICTAVLTDDSNATATGNTLELTNGSTVELSTMQFVGKILEGTYAGYVLTYNGDKVSFPVTFTKVADSSAASTAKAAKLTSRTLTKSHSVKKCAPANYVELR